MHLTMERARRLQIQQLGPELTCHLCHGYFVDAFTVVECLHSFCKSCIMKHVKQSSDCPRCGIQLNKARLTAAVRPDQTLQSVVYKLVPRLFNGEMQRRRDFYQNHSHRDRSLSPERRGDVSSQQFVYTLSDPISFSLEFCRSGSGSDEKTDLPAVRYFQAPAGLGISHLKKLLHLKHGLEPRDAKVDILCGGDVLPEDASVMDVACQYNRDRTVPMAFFYRWTRKRAAPAAAPPPKRPKNATAPEAGAVAANAATVAHQKEAAIAVQEIQVEGGARLGGAPLPRAAPQQGTAPADGPRPAPAAGETLPAPQSITRPAVADSESARTPREASDVEPPLGVTGAASGAGTGRGADSGASDSHSSALLTNGVASGGSGGSASKTSAPPLSGTDGRSSGYARSDGSDAKPTVNSLNGVSASEAVSVEANGVASNGSSINANGSQDKPISYSKSSAQTHTQTPATAAKGSVTQSITTYTKTRAVAPEPNERVEKHSTKANGNSVGGGTGTVDGTNGHNTKRRLKKVVSGADKARNGDIRSVAKSITSKTKSLSSNGVDCSSMLPSNTADVKPGSTEVAAALPPKGAVSSCNMLNPITKKSAPEPGEIVKSHDHPHPVNASALPKHVLPNGSTTSTNGAVANMLSPSSLSSPSSIALTHRPLASYTYQQGSLLSRSNTAARCREYEKKSAITVTTSSASRNPTNDSSSRLSVDVYDFDDEAEEEAAVRLKIPTPTKEVSSGESKHAKLQQSRERYSHSTKNGHGPKTNGPGRARLEKKPTTLSLGVKSVLMKGVPLSTPVQRPAPPSTSAIPPQRPPPPSTLAAPVQHPPHPSTPVQRPAVGQGPSPVPFSPRRSLAPLPDLRPIGAGAIPLMTGQLDRFLRMVSQSAVSQPNGSWRLPADASSLLTRAAAPTQQLVPGKLIQPKPVLGKSAGQNKPAVQAKSGVQTNQTVQTETTASTKSSVQTKNAVQSRSSVQNKSMSTGRKTPTQLVSSKQNGSSVTRRPSSDFPVGGMISGEVSITRISRAASGSTGGRPAPSPLPVEPFRSPGSAAPAQAPAGRVSADGSVTIEKIRAAPPPPPPPQSDRPANSPKLLAIAESLAMRKIQSQRQAAGGPASKAAPSPAAAVSPSALSSLISLSQTQQFHKQQQQHRQQQRQQQQQQQQQTAPEAEAAPRGRPAASSNARSQIPNPALLHHQSQGRLTVLDVPPAETAGSGTAGTTSASLARMERLTNSLGR